MCRGTAVLENWRPQQSCTHCDLMLSSLVASSAERDRHQRRQCANELLRRQAGGDQETVCCLNLSLSTPAFLLQSATDIDGVNVPMSRYAGKLVVAVNVASEDHVRGYTSQNYARLNYLYDKYKPRGLEVRARHG